jgi:hypothetical protein
VDCGGRKQRSKAEGSGRWGQRWGRWRKVRECGVEGGFW